MEVHKPCSTIKKENKILLFRCLQGYKNLKNTASALVI